MTVFLHSPHNTFVNRPDGGLSWAGAGVQMLCLVALEDPTLLHIHLYPVVC